MPAMPLGPFDLVTCATFTFFGGGPENNMLVGTFQQLLTLLTQICHWVCSHTGIRFTSKCANVTANLKYII